MALRKTFDEQIELITTKYVQDDLNQFVATETKETRWVSKQSTNRSRYYQSAISDFQPELTIEMRRFEYEGQEFIEYLEQRYKVNSTYDVDNEIIGLACERVQRGN